MNISDELVLLEALGLTIDTFIDFLLIESDEGDNQVKLIKTNIKSPLGWTTFDIHHPIHGKIGTFRGTNYKDTFRIHWMDLDKHPIKLEIAGSRVRSSRSKEALDLEAREPKVSRTLIKSILRSFREHYPHVTTIVGDRVTGTHNKHVVRSGDISRFNTKIKIPMSH